MAQETIEIKIKSNIPQVDTEVKSYRKQIRDLKKQLDTLDQSSQEYTETLAKLAQTTADYKDELMIINNAAGDFDSVLTNMTKIGADIAAGFNVATAAQALFGSNSEALQKTMVKFQAALAMLAGLKGLQGLSKDLKSVTISIKAMTTGFKGAGGAAGVFKASLKGIKTAIAETGIGLLVIAVAALIANWKSIAKLFGYTTPQEKAEESVKKLNDELDRLNNNLNVASDEALVKYTQALKDAGGDEEAIAKATAEYNKEVNDAKYKYLTDSVAAHEKNVADLEEQYANARTKKQKADIKEKLDAEKKSQQESISNLHQFENQRAKETADADAKRTKAAQDDSDKRVKAAQDAAQAKVEADIKERESINKTTDAYRKSTEQIIENYNAQIALIKGINAKQIDTTPLDFLKTKFELSKKTALELKSVYEEENKASEERIASLEKERAENKKQADSYMLLPIAKEAYLKKVKEIDEKLETEKAIKKKRDDAHEQAMQKLYENGYPVDSDTLEKSYTKFNETLERIKGLYEAGIYDESTVHDAVSALRRDFEAEIDTTVDALKDLSEEKREALKVVFKSLGVDMDDFINTIDEKNILNKIDKISADVENKIFGKTKEIKEEVKRRFKEQQDEDKDNWVDTIDVNANFGEGILDFLQSYVQPAVHKTYQKMYQDEQKHADAIYESNKAQLNAVVEGADEKLKIEGLTAEQQKEIEREKTDAQIQLQDLEMQHYEDAVNRKNKLDAQRQAVMKRSIQVASTMFSNLADLNRTNANDETKSQASREKSFKKYKKLKKASAIIDTFQAANEAYASMASIPYVGPVLGAAAAAAAIVAGIANVKAIDQEKFSGSSTSSSSTPDVNASLMNGDANSSLLSDESNYDINSVQPETKVYVTESDITGTQNDVETKVRESTF